VPPSTLSWHLAAPARWRELYEIVLLEGTLDDIRALINSSELARTVSPTLTLSSISCAALANPRFCELTAASAPEAETFVDT